MNLPKRTLEQKIQRVSQMRRLGLSLREAYERQFLLPQWLARFEVLCNLPPGQFPTQFSRHDIDALRAGIRKNWAEGRYAVIVEVADKLPVVVLQQNHVLAAFIGAAREQLRQEA
ncbi:hypothetical protein L0337_01800 [candidate division KSB1 bacterium]|nr:hypothetical protein [candidate division KSB1 bacterium]